MRTVDIVLSFYGNQDYMMLLSTWESFSNVRVERDGRVTICFTEDDIKFLVKHLGRIYDDIDGLNKERKKKAQSLDKPFH
jgi:hypothetical protein